jgi:hypothetical protein
MPTLPRAWPRTVLLLALTVALGLLALAAYVAARPAAGAPAAQRPAPPPRVLIPSPYRHTGRGDASLPVRLPQPGDPALARITHRGPGAFAVWNVDSGGNRLNLLVDTTGAYTGTLPIDFLVSENTATFEVAAADAWTIELLPLLKIRVVRVPAAFTGHGDDVVHLAALDPARLTVDASHATGNLVVWAYGPGRALLIDDYAPYTGLVTVPRETSILVIHAAGPWSMDVTAR